MARTFTVVRNGPHSQRRATKCIFCGSLPPLTAEHIFSHWTHRYLPPRSMKKYEVMRAETYLNRSDRALIKRSGDIRDWQVRCVCGSICNNGWMRQKVDEPAQQIMIPLISGQHHFSGESIRIAPREQRIIATWAALKAMVAEYDSFGWVTSHHTHRKLLMRTLTPPPRGWAVWIGHYVRQRWKPYWASNPFFYASEKEIAFRPQIRPSHYNSQISTQVIGQLLIHVIRSPAVRFVERWRFNTPDRGTMFRIWPASSISINWPGTTLTDRDADYVASAMAQDLAERGRKLYEKALADGTAEPDTVHALADLDRLWPKKNNG